MKRALPLLALMLLVHGLAVAERPNGFSVLGPGGGGAMFHPLISPHDPATALVACDMTGSYITHDGGASWRMFNLRGVVRFFLFDPTLPNVIYAAATGLWRSNDSGVTWQLIAPSPTTIQAISRASDHSDEKIISSDNPLEIVDALAIDPADSNHLYAAAGGTRPALFESTDQGAHWTRSFDLPEPASKMWIGPGSSLLIVGNHSVTHRAGASVKHSSPMEIIDSSAGTTSDGRWLLYAATKTGIKISSDAGSTWTEAALPGTGAKVRAIATSFYHPNTAYASYSELRLDGTAWHGVARTTNAGKTWQLVWKEAVAPATNVEDAWITPRFGTDWGENPLDLTAADQDPQLVYGTDFGRTLISKDGGDHWHAAYSRQTADGAWTSTGLDVTTSYGIHFDPHDSNREFITYTDISLFRSDTAGKSWQSSSTGIPKEWLNTTYWMVFDPDVKGRAWTVNSSTHDLPRPKMWRHTATSTYQGGVCRSEDGGLTWSPSNAGMPPTAPTDIVLDPASPKGHRTLYVTAFGRGVFKSTDDGKTWSLRNKGISQTSPFAWRITLAEDRSLYLVIARRSEDGSIGNDGDGAIYRSVDGAETWTPLPMPAGSNAPYGIAVEPSHPEHLYLAAWARAIGTRGEGGGVYQSHDGGQHWLSSLDRDQHIYDVTVDPRIPGTVYASGFESSAWVSRDSGAHWERIAGYNFKWGHRVVLDPKDPASIYITTYGGGVWHGKVNTEHAFVDIITPEMDPPL